MYRNKLLKEYTRKQLEELFIQLCESLDDRANDIYELEKKLSNVKRKHRIIREQAEADDKRDVEYTGKQVPEVNESTKNEIEKCLMMIDMLDLELRREEVKKNQVLRELNYIRSYFVFPNKKYKAADINTHSTIQLKNDLMEILQKTYGKCGDWKSKNKCLCCLNILKIDFDSAISFFKDNSTEDDLIFREKEINDEIANVELDILHLTKEKEEKKAKKDRFKKKVNELEDKYNELVERERDKYLEKTALETHIHRKEKEFTNLDYLRHEIEQLNKQIANLKHDISNRQLYLMQQLGNQSINCADQIRNLETENYAIQQYISNLKKTNEENQKKVEEKEKALGKEKDLYDSLQTNLNVAKGEYSGIRNKFYELVSGSSSDPFGSTAFQIFMDQLATERITIHSIKDLIAENMKIEEKNKQLRQKILLKHETEKKLVDDLNEVVYQARRRQYDYEHSKVKLETREDYYLYEGQNGFILTFNDFAFSGMKNQEVYLTIQFLGQYIDTQTIKIGSFTDEISCLIPCDKEGIVTKIVTQYIIVTLKRMNGEVIATGTTDVTPLVDADEIVTSIELITPTKKTIAAASLHVALVEPLY